MLFIDNKVKEKIKFSFEKGNLICPSQLRCYDIHDLFGDNQRKDFKFEK